ncbi:hypothetical protein J3458_007285 [Metarhizium acridum]|uniref:uncharacterized protein n=1 Tax=Metarhizium acridum TaxID=92637 RepID=UPI001C6CD513|nr:hypothetical protein J3458_007285 [Metarhizium acridum]
MRNKHHHSSVVVPEQQACPDPTDTLNLAVFKGKWSLCGRNGQEGDLSLPPAKRCEQSSGQDPTYVRRQRERRTCAARPDACSC